MVSWISIKNQLLGIRALSFMLQTTTSCVNTKLSMSYVIKIVGLTPHVIFLIFASKFLISQLEIVVFCLLVTLCLDCHRILLVSHLCGALSSWFLFFFLIWFLDCQSFLCSSSDGLFIYYCSLDLLGNYFLHSIE